MRDIEKELRLFTCWCVRNTPLNDGRVVWDLLTDERSRNAVVVAERFANGDATPDELSAARAAAWDAVLDAARDSAGDAARAAARDAARAAAWAAARDADAAWPADAVWPADAAWPTQKDRFAEVIKGVTPEEFREEEG